MISRREFLVAGAALAAAGLAGGCSGGSGSSTSFSLLPDTFDFVAGVNQRVAVALADATGNPITPSSAPTLQIGPVGGALSAPIATTVHDVGIPAYVRATYLFPVPGNYTLRVTYRGHHADFTATVISPTSTAIPLVGRALINVPTPTAANTLGVNPICTATPPCPFHAISLDQALAEHRPIALQFATPALCQSRLCGPVLQNLVDVHQPFADRVTFIHAEIYTNLSGLTQTPPVLAYHLIHEPLLFLAGSDGVVRARIDNGYDRTEATSALSQLVSS